MWFIGFWMQKGFVASSWKVAFWKFKFFQQFGHFEWVSYPWPGKDSRRWSHPKPIPPQIYTFLQLVWTVQIYLKLVWKQCSKHRLPSYHEFFSETDWQIMAFYHIGHVRFPHQSWEEIIHLKTRQIHQQANSWVNEVDWFDFFFPLCAFKPPPQFIEHLPVF
jgi:hypothetical protein